MINERYGDEIRLEAAALFEQGFAYKAVGRKLGMSATLMKKWMYTYRALGKEALLVTAHKTYDLKTKLAAVHDFLDGNLSKPEIMAKYEIASESPLKMWIKLYREGGEDALRPRPKGRPHKPENPVYASREEELEARIRELELELEIQKRINALADEIERGSHRR